MSLLSVVIIIDAQELRRESGLSLWPRVKERCLAECGGSNPARRIASAQSSKSTPPQDVLISSSPHPYRSCYVNPKHLHYHIRLKPRSSHDERPLILFTFWFETYFPHSYLYSSHLLYLHKMLFTILIWITGVRSTKNYNVNRNANRESCFFFKHRWFLQEAGEQDRILLFSVTKIKVKDKTIYVQRLGSCRVRLSVDDLRTDLARFSTQSVLINASREHCSTVWWCDGKWQWLLERLSVMLFIIMDPDTGTVAVL